MGLGRVGGRSSEIYLCLFRAASSCQSWARQGSVRRRFCAAFPVLADRRQVESSLTAVPLRNLGPRSRSCLRITVAHSSLGCELKPMLLCHCVRNEWAKASYDDGRLKR